MADLEGLSTYAKSACSLGWVYDLFVLYLGTMERSLYIQGMLYGYVHFFL